MLPAQPLPESQTVYGTAVYQLPVFHPLPIAIKAIFSFIKFLNFQHHGFDRHLYKIRIRSVRINRFVDDLISFIVRNPAVIYINSHPLNGNIRSSACLSD